MNHELSLATIEQACMRLGIHLTEQDAKRIHNVLTEVIRKSESGVQAVPRYLELPEQVRPREARQILNSLWQLRERLDDVGYQSPTLDALIDDLAEEFVPLSVGAAGMKPNYKHLHLFARLATFYADRFGKDEKLTEKSRGMQFIIAMLTLAGVHVPPRTLRLWADTRLAIIANEQVDLDTDLADFIAQIKASEDSNSNAK